MKTPKDIHSLKLIGTCEVISMALWEKYMNNTTKANGKLIRKHIKDHLPELYDILGLKFYNPYEYKCVKKDGLFVYVHSGIEYFLKYN